MNDQRGVEVLQLYTELSDFVDARVYQAALIMPTDGLQHVGDWGSACKPKR